MTRRTGTTPEHGSERIAAAMTRTEAEVLVDAFDQAVCDYLEPGGSCDEQLDMYLEARRSLIDALTSQV